ncbi:hypothetical protein B0E53_00426 [Micromonospora sp. MH33]|nr:hypothetical protein B0E53_00426 [Micromonospora sp. MH33]
MRIEYGSAYDDDAANEGRPVHEIEAERRRDLIFARADAAGPRSAARYTRLEYFRYSPHSESRQILVMTGKRSWGELDFDLCRRCRRGHVWTLGLLAVMHGEGWEIRMLHMARTKAPDDYRWTRSGQASRSKEFWDHVPPELSSEPEDLCEHLPCVPSRLREVWACVRYWRLTGRLHWPDSQERRAFRLRKGARGRPAT